MTLKLRRVLEGLEKNLKSSLHRVPEQTVKDLYTYQNKKPEMQSGGPNDRRSIVTEQGLTTVN